MHDDPTELPSDLPFPYEIDESTSVLYAAVGPWSPEAVARWVDAVRSDPRYVPGMRAVLNLRYAAGPLPTTETMRAIVDALSPLLSIPIRTRWAVLVGSPVLYDRVRLLETLTSGSCVQVRGFLEHTEAITWLGLHRNDGSQN